MVGGGDSSLYSTFSLSSESLCDCRVPLLGLPHYMPTAGVHQDTLTRARADLFECRRILESYIGGVGLLRLCLGRNAFQRPIHKESGKVVTTQQPSLRPLLHHRMMFYFNHHGYPLAHPVLGLRAVTILSWNVPSFLAHWIEFPATVSPELKCIILYTL